MSLNSTNTRLTVPLNLPLVLFSPSPFLRWLLSKYIYFILKNHLLCRWSCSYGYAYICTMGKYKKLSHVIYKCDYHIVWVPKYRLRILKGAVKSLVEKDIRSLCEWKGCEVDELNIQEDHIHLLVPVPPKFPSQN